MSETSMPPAIRAFVDATNRGDSDAFVAAFADDAYLNDWGREFRGREGVASWNETDNIGKQSQFDVHGIVEGRKPDQYLLTVTVSGNGSASVTLSGTPAAVNAALQVATYAPSADYHGAASLTLSVNDGSSASAASVGIGVRP